MGEYKKAKDFYEGAIEIQMKTFGPDHVNIATMYSNLGSVYSDMGEYEKAKDFYERATKIQTKAFGPDCVNIAATCNNLRLVSRGMVKVEKAKDFFELAMEIVANKLVDDDEILNKDEVIGTRSTPQAPHGKENRKRGPLSRHKNDESSNDDSSEDDSTRDDSSDDDSTRDDSSSDDNSINNSPGYGASNDLFKSEDDHSFEKMFLDDEYDIKEDVHIKLKSLPGMRGVYGKVGPNKKLPYFHLFITVDYESVDEAVLKDKIDEMFGPNASRYFEFRPKPSTTPKLQLLSKIAVERNSRRVSRGTLTMFCYQNGKHYALTCCHVCYNGDGDDKIYEMLNQNKNDPNEFKLHLSTNQYNYTSPSEPKISLGHFSDYKLETNMDILSIEVNEDFNENCRRNRIHRPSWNDVWRELNRRVHVENETVEVKKYEKYKIGKICDVSYSCNEPEKKVVYQDAVLVKSEEHFLKSGESGVLVYFRDEHGRRIPFGYGIARVYHEELCEPRSVA
ncbi:uncharacterized protein LOC124443376 isoform X2 [Xenia sp. Carnegie-2017]|uniref:uncharacterized protein LOC124443376 isoform X2 n=1 Tax=Xenia sp. Carnegie-2017 TaxID=2897299 RepID=UPI001F04D3AC|nr:uncharacterized protein LOC124443376 isoform X2 [Xenia sp. Carnegie-2017]